MYHLCTTYVPLMYHLCTTYVPLTYVSHIHSTVFQGTYTPQSFKTVAVPTEPPTYYVGGSVGTATALKAGGCGFKSHLSSHFIFYENRKEGSQVCCLGKRTLRFVALFFLYSLKFTCPDLSSLVLRTLVILNFIPFLPQSVPICELTIRRQTRQMNLRDLFSIFIEIKAAQVGFEPTTSCFQCSHPTN